MRPANFAGRKTMGLKDDKEFLGQVFDDHYRMEIRKGDTDAALTVAIDVAEKLQQTNKDQRAEIVRLRSIVQSLQASKPWTVDLDSGERSHIKLSVAKLETIFPSLNGLASVTPDVIRDAMKQGESPFNGALRGPGNSPDYLAEPILKEIEKVRETLVSVISEVESVVCNYLQDT
jgi:hypothetical protein